jgi:hypothetical protein
MQMRAEPASRLLRCWLSAFLQLDTCRASRQQAAIGQREVGHVEVTGLEDLEASKAQEREHANDPQYARNIDSLIVRASNNVFKPVHL